MINELSIYHAAGQPWQFVGNNRRVRLLLRVATNSNIRVFCLSCDPCDTHISSDGILLPNLIREEMQPAFLTDTEKYFSLEMVLITHKLRYHFELVEDNKVWVYDETGLSVQKDEAFIRPFFISYIYDRELFHAPEWAEEAIWYQIFPDRFCNADSLLTPAGALPWKSEPISDKDAVYGGDLAGITSKLAYIKQLGATGIYLNPVFYAASIHKYDTIDYLEVDPAFGNKQAFKDLCKECHKNGLRIMLDGVLNHCSNLCAQFQDVLAKGNKSPYYNWFIINKPNEINAFEQQTDLSRINKKDAAYEAFAFVPSMPKWNTANPQVIEYLTGIAEYWTRLCNIDAWRLDVPDEVSAQFLRTLRSRLKNLNSDIYIIGEIWSNASKWLQGDMFDGVMNYTLYYAIRDFAAAGAIDATAFARRVTSYLVLYPNEVQRGMFNFCSNHDLARILTLCGGNRKRVLLCYLLTCVMLGGLSVYYGDEIPLFGGADPDNRRCMPWDNEQSDKDYTEELKKILLLKKLLSEKGLACCALTPVNEDTLKISLDSQDNNILYLTCSENNVLLDIPSEYRMAFGSGNLQGAVLFLPSGGYLWIEKNV